MSDVQRQIAAISTEKTKIARDVEHADSLLYDTSSLDNSIEIYSPSSSARPNEELMWKFRENRDGCTYRAKHTLVEIILDLRLRPLKTNPDNGPPLPFKKLPINPSRVYSGYKKVSHSLVSREKYVLQRMTVEYGTLSEWRYYIICF